MGCCFLWAVADLTRDAGRNWRRSHYSTIKNLNRKSKTIILQNGWLNHSNIMPKPQNIINMATKIHPKSVLKTMKRRDPKIHAFLIICWSKIWSNSNPPNFKNRWKTLRHQLYINEESKKIVYYYWVRIPSFFEEKKKRSWVQNRPLDLLRPPIDVKFYGESLGNGTKSNG